MAKKVKKNLKYDVALLYSKEDGGYIATIPELPGCSAFGETPYAALKEIETARELWLEAARAEKRSIPEPVSAKSYTGKVALRLPPELQQELTLKARSQGISLNQYLVYVLARFQDLGSRVAQEVLSNDR